MTSQNSQVSFEEFVNLCNLFLRKAKCRKKYLADKLGLEYTYFSKVYNGARPFPEHLLDKIKGLFKSQDFDNLPSEPNSQEPKSKSNLDLPNDVSKIREEISRLQAIQDAERKENRELRERVAVLENDLERSKSDSEKKIYGLEAKFAASLKYEIERATGRLAGGRREANG